MKKIFFWCLFLVFSFITVSAQSEQDEDVPIPRSLQKGTTEKPERKIKFTTGGGLGFQFSSYYTAISISPIIGVYPVDWLLVGLEASYMYTYSGGDSFHDFGADIFLRGLIWKKRLIIQAGYKYFNIDSYGNDRYDAQAIYLGPGYRFSAGDRVSFHILLLFNVASWSSQGSNRDVYPLVTPNIGVTFDF